MLMNIQDSYFVQCLFQGRLVFLQSGRGALHLRFLGLEIGHMSRQFLDSLVQQLFLWADLLNVLVKVLLSLLSLHQHLKKQTQIFWYPTVLALHDLGLYWDDEVYWLFILFSVSITCEWWSILTVWDWRSWPSNSARRTSLSATSFWSPWTRSSKPWFCFLASFRACLQKCDQIITMTNWFSQRINHLHGIPCLEINFTLTLTFQAISSKHFLV